jgi:hypothetical protein
MFVTYSDAKCEVPSFTFTAIGYTGVLSAGGTCYSKSSGSYKLEATGSSATCDGEPASSIGPIPIGKCFEYGTTSAVTVYVKIDKFTAPDKVTLSVYLDSSCAAKIGDSQEGKVDECSQDDEGGGLMIKKSINFSASPTTAMWSPLVISGVMFFGSILNSLM